MAVTLLKRTYRKKRTYKRKRPYKRYVKKYISRPISKIHSFKRTMKLTNIQATTSASGGNISFSLSQLPNYTEWTNLFDSYRIKAVSVKLIPSLTTGTLGTGAISVGSMWWALDRNDLTNPTSLNEILQYDTLKHRRLTSINTRYLKVNNYDADEAKQEWNNWHSTANADVTYYGIKYWKEGVSSGTLDIEPFVTYYLQFKSVI